MNNNYENLPAVLNANQLAAALGIGCTLGYLFGSSYRMDWQPVDTSEQAQTETIRQQLLDLGFPEDVLNDLTPEDIAACDGALRVVSVTEDHPFNDGRTVSHKQSDGEGGVVSVLDTVYDVKELRLTSVGVQLPGAQETWRVYDRPDVRLYRRQTCFDPARVRAILDGTGTQRH